MKRHSINRYVRLGLLSLMLLGMGVSACSDEDGGDGFEAVENVQMQLIPESHVFETIRIGEPASVLFQITNTSPEVVDLIISETRLEAGSDFSLDCTPNADEAYSLANTKAATCTLTFIPSTAEAQTGRVVLLNNSENFPDAAFTFTTQLLQPRIEAVPPVAQFNAREGQTSTQDVRIRNVGEFPLNISGFELTSGGNVFDIKLPSDVSYPEISNASPLRLEPHDASIGQGAPGYVNNELLIEVTYTPQTTGSDEGTLTIYSDDPTVPSLTVDLDASSNAPCILLVEGTRVDFQESRIGGLNPKTITVQNCGNAPLEITRLEPGENAAMLTDDSNTSAVFLVDPGTDRPGVADGTLDAPIIIEPNETDTFIIGYAPLREEPNTGSVFIHSNDDLQPRVQLDLFGRGVINQCPVAIASATIEGESIPPSAELQAKPLDDLLLDGTASMDPDGTVIDWQWNVVESPDGSVAEVVPTGQGQAALFLDLAGRFVIELTAIDDGGVPSCEPARVTVLVVPSEAVHIQLVWNNPQDPNQGDITGSDVDLHFVKMGPGSWNQAPYDTYWLNTEPFWTPENPSLDRDDTNGAGPENVNLDDPVPCTWYAVGVYYFRQQFGTAYTTVRIFINGLLVFEYLNKPLQQTGDWWDVARVHWPTGSIIMVDEEGDSLPTGVRPAVTDGMIDSGLCGVDEIMMP
ncbi:MAG: hypothetical protein AAFX99_11985 [Myxococcota bacterium]